MALNDLDKRVRYFPGQYLLEEDFEHEQNYHRDRLQRINRQLHVSGITDGLKVFPGDGLTVNITQGDAIDDQGQQIVLLSQTSFKIEDGTSGNHILYVLYPDPEKQKLDDFQQADDNNTGRRLHEQPIFSLALQGGTKPTGAIALAKLTIRNNNIVTPIDETVRQYSGLRLPSADTVSAPTLRSSGNSNPSLVMLQGSLRVTGNTTVDGELTITGTSTLSGALTVTSTTTLSGKLTVNNQVELKGAVGKIGLVVDSEGKVGIGTSSPQASLSVETPESYGGDTIRFEAKAEPNVYNLSLNTEVTDSNVRWVFNQVNNNRHFKSILTFDKGNVGIGIANPQATLDVRSSSSGTGTLRTDGTAVTGIGTQFQTQLKVGHMITATYSANDKSYTETRQVTAITNNSSLTVDFPFTSNITTAINFTFQPPLLVVQSGKVGIGTSNPQSMLDVQGKITSPMWKAEQVINDRKYLGPPAPNAGNRHIRTQEITTGGGTVIFFVSGICHVNSLALIIISINTSEVGRVELKNITDTRIPFFTTCISKQILPGQHDLKIEINDRYTYFAEDEDQLIVTMIEFPF